MRDENWDKVKEIFLAVIELEPGKRSLFLNSLCDGNDDLKREVESLIVAHSEADTLYETPVLNVPSALKFQDGEFSGRVGAYKIEREIGRGGMGAVYLAVRDDDQFKKQVAVKFIRQTGNNREAVRRFRDERQILAALEHPNIARLLDGGETEDGSPYLVMEYVEGVPIDDYCADKQLSTDDRLKLFLKVCGAVHFAHQHLVIHRDLKPGNILVTETGEPKLLDFGIAKLLNPELRASDAKETVPAARLLTPEYASPEQVRGLPITTVSDVYSLGVVLYELLTGATPYQLKNKRFEEIIRIVGETNPTKPSEAVTRRGGDTARDAGKRRRGDAEKNDSTPEPKIAASPRLSVSASQLKGDIDNIVLMAMRKESERRYKSVEQFAEDIRRHLEGLTVIAREDTFSYRASKFIRRNKIGVAAAALVFLATVSGIAATLWQASVAREQARIAAEQRDRAQLAQFKASRINEFLQKMLGAAAPDKDGREVKVIEVLENAERQAREELAAQPEVLAEVLQTIGGTYLNLAQYEPAEKSLRSALEIYRQLPGDLQTARCAAALGDLMIKTGRYEEAETLLRQAVEIFRRHQPGASKELVESLAMLGASLVNRGEYAQGETFLQESLALARNVFGEESEEMSYALHELATLYNLTDNTAGEIEIYRRIIPILRKNPSMKNALATVNLNLGMSLLREGNLTEAEPLFQDGIRLYREIYGEDNVRVANALVLLAQLRVRQKRYAEAQAEAEKAIAMQKKYLPPDNEMFIGSWSALGVALTKQGKAREGEPFLRQTLDAIRKLYPAGDWGVSQAESRLGECLAGQKRFAEAEPLLLRGYENIKASLGENQFITVEALQRVIKFYEDSGKAAKAASYRKLLPQA